MTFSQDEIISMAREAGLPFEVFDDEYCDCVGLERGTISNVNTGIRTIQRFAALVAAKERERVLNALLDEAGGSELWPDEIKLTLSLFGQKESA